MSQLTSGRLDCNVLLLQSLSQCHAVFLHHLACKIMDCIHIMKSCRCLDTLKNIHPQFGFQTRQPHVAYNICHIYICGRQTWNDAQRNFCCKSSKSEQRSRSFSLKFVFQWRFCRRHVGSWWMAGASRRRSSSKPMEPLPGTQPSIGDQWMEKLHLPLNRIFVDISFKGPHPPKLQSLGHFYIDENITWASTQAPHIPEKNCMELIIIFWGVVHTDCATAGTGLLASCSCWQSNQCGNKQVWKQASKQVGQWPEGAGQLREDCRKNPGKVWSHC